MMMKHRLLHLLCCVSFLAVVQAQTPDREVTIFAPLWRLEGGFTTTIAINNSLPKPVVAQILLYDDSGNKIPVDDLHLGPLESRDVPLDSLIPRREGFGSIGMKFVGQPLDLAAQVVLKRRDGRVVFNGGFMHATSFRGSRLEGISAIGGVSPLSRIAFANTTDQARRVKIGLRTDSGTSAMELSLRPHETQLLKLSDLGAGGREGDRPRRPGPAAVTIEHDGAAGDVRLHGLMQEPGGAATNMHFTEVAKLRSTRLVSPILRALPAQRPLLALNNLTSDDLQVRTTLHYRVGEDVLTAIGEVIDLPADAVIGVDLTPSMRSLPGDAVDLGLSLEYDGKPASITSELVLLDTASGTVVQSTPKDTLGEGTISLSFPFRLDSGAETIIALANPSTTEEVLYCVFILYDGQTYTWIQDKTLVPGEVRHVNIRELRDLQIPGEKDVTLPPDLNAGQVKTVVHNGLGENHRMVGQSLQVSGDGSTSAFLSCPVCPPDPSHVTLSASSFGGEVGTNQQVTPYIHWSDGTFKINNNPYAIDWFPGSSSVATVSEAWSNFRVNFGPQPGTTTLGAQMPNECHYEYDWYTGECACLHTILAQLSPAASVCSAQVDVQSANLPLDRITVQLLPTTKSEVLTVQVRNNGTGFTHTVNSTQRSGGTHNISFAIPGLPNDKFFDEVRAVWTVCNSTADDDLTYKFKVLGNYLHSQYNFPAESGCSTAPTRSVTIISSSTCFGSTVSSTLRDQFASQVSLNGSGTSVSHGKLKALAATSCWNGRPGWATNDNTFVTVSQFTGSCNTTLTNSSLARCDLDSDLACGASVFTDVLDTTKSVADRCPACFNVSNYEKLDNFNASSTACVPGQLGHLGTGLKTIKLGPF